jgi:hypothetical protein
MRRIDRIHERLERIDAYPAGVLPLGGRISGTSFFPGGDGLWKEEDSSVDIPIGGVMVIGHNFDNVKGFQQSLLAGKEPLSSPTWRNLLQMLSNFSIAPSECFFTNAYVGVIDAESNVGDFPGGRSPIFVEKCLDLLAFEIEVQRPRLILTLGAFVPQLIASMSPSLATWRGHKSLIGIDKEALPFIPHASFCNGAVKATVVPLTHPAQRHLNVHRRYYRGVNGHDAECMMIEDACATVDPVR